MTQIPDISLCLTIEAVNFMQAHDILYSQIYQKNVTTFGVSIRAHKKNTKGEHNTQCSLTYKNLTKKGRNQRKVVPVITCI